MKTPLALLFLATAAFAHAAGLPAKITEDTKLEFTRGKGSVVLKAGTPIQVVSQDGDTLDVLYRGSINGRVLRAKTDFKGEAPKVAVAAPAAQPESAPAAPAPKPVAPTQTPTPAPAKSAETKPAAPANPPTTLYGKAVQKARENEAKHRENMVDPVDEVTGAKKKDATKE
jgi:hypothetical protein